MLKICNRYLTDGLYWGQHDIDMTTSTSFTENNHCPGKVIARLNLLKSAEINVTRNLEGKLSYKLRIF